jgi:hypothetical protein
VGGPPDSHEPKTATRPPSTIARKIEAVSLDPSTVRRTASSTSPRSNIVAAAAAKLQNRKAPPFSDRTTPVAALPPPSALRLPSNETNLVVIAVLAAEVEMSSLSKTVLAHRS